MCTWPIIKHFLKLSLNTGPVTGWYHSSWVAKITTSTYVYMFTGNPSETESNWTKVRGLSKKSYFPKYLNEQIWLATHHRLSCSQLWSRPLSLGWKTWRGIREPFQALSQLILLGIQRANPTSQVGEITKYSPRRTHCKLWICFFGCELEGTSADVGNTTSAQHRFTNLWIILQS